MRVSVLGHAKLAVPPEQQVQQKWMMGAKKPEGAREGEEMHPKPEGRVQLSSTHPSRGARRPRDGFSLIEVQRWNKRLVCVAKQGLGRARHGSLARLGRKLSQPCTSLLLNLCRWV